jgi:hypothetical protein
MWREKCKHNQIVELQMNASLHQLYLTHTIIVWSLPWDNNVWCRLHHVPTAGEHDEDEDYALLLTCILLDSLRQRWLLQQYKREKYM